jgi:hypothetical protein
VYIGLLPTEWDMVPLKMLQCVPAHVVSETSLHASADVAVRRCLAACFGGIALAAVFDALAFDNAHFMGGAPDLILFRIVRVPGRRDTAAAAAAAGGGGGGAAPASASNGVHCDGGAAHAVRRGEDGAAVCVHARNKDERSCVMSAVQDGAFRRQRHAGDFVLPPEHCGLCGCDWNAQVCAPKA